MKWTSCTRSVLQRRSALCHERNISTTYDEVRFACSLSRPQCDTARSDMSWNRMFVKMNVPVIIWMNRPLSPVQRATFQQRVKAVQVQGPTSSVFTEETYCSVCVFVWDNKCCVHEGTLVSATIAEQLASSLPADLPQLHLQQAEERRRLADR